MFAILASLVFAGAAFTAAFAAAATVHQSRSRIADALKGRPLARITPALSAAS